MSASHFSLWMIMFGSFFQTYARQSPHIILIVADDLGWNDVSWHNPSIHTPNLERLARNGVILNQSYVNPVCTPSRSSLMTGYYPHHVGRQNHVLHPLVPTGVPLKFAFLPEKLREAGYSTHMIGKWHLGFCNLSYTPTFRGFDTFFGFYTGALDYFSHTRSAVEKTATSKWNLPDIDVGYDLRDGLSPSTKYNGVYSTNLFSDAAESVLASNSPDIPLFLYLSFQAVHSPVQVPKMYEDIYRDLPDEKRRKYSGMVTAIDDAIGNLVQGLKKYGFWKDCVLVFTTDNGGQTVAGGNNWPLRGNKGTLWEGGTRAVTFVHSKRLKKTNYVNNKLFHVVDWFPTLLHLAGVSPDGEYDGISQWKTISQDGASKRKEFVYNIYDTNPVRAAVRVGDYKLIVGFPGNPSGWMPPPSSKRPSQDDQCHVKKVSANGTYIEDIRLYNIRDDPTERNNLAEEKREIVVKLMKRLQKLKETMVPADDPPVAEMGDPSHWGGIFSPGWCIAK